MPSRGTHMIVGAAAGLGATVCFPVPYENIDSAWYRLGALVGGVCGAITPDIIDPPRSPGHRGIGHSVTANTVGLSGLSFFLQDAESYFSDLIQEAQADQRHFLAALLQFIAGLLWGFVAGQVSHLALDILTPKGLPM